MDAAPQVTRDACGAFTSAAPSGFGSRAHRVPLIVWGSLGDLVVALHAAYLVFQVLGGMLVPWLGRRVLLLHLAAVTWGVVVVAMQWRCPLTVVEKALRSRSGESPYAGSFLDHYVFGSYLPNGSQEWVYALHLVVIVAVYLALAESRLGPRRSRAPQQVPA